MGPGVTPHLGKATYNPAHLQSRVIKTVWTRYRPCASRGSPEQVQGVVVGRARLPPSGSRDAGNLKGCLLDDKRLVIAGTGEGGEISGHGVRPP